MACVEEIGRDTANYYLSSVAPTLRSIAGEYERKKFDDAVTAGQTSVHLTTQWLAKLASTLPAVNELLSAVNVGNVQPNDLRREDEVAIRKLVAVAFVDLLQVNFQIPNTTVDWSVMKYVPSYRQICALTHHKQWRKFCRKRFCWMASV